MTRRELLDCQLMEVLQLFKIHYSIDTMHEKTMESGSGILALQYYLPYS